MKHVPESLRIPDAAHTSENVLTLAEVEAELLQHPIASRFYSYAQEMVTRLEPIAEQETGIRLGVMGQYDMEYYSGPRFDRIQLKTGFHEDVVVMRHALIRNTGEVLFEAECDQQQKVRVVDYTGLIGKNDGEIQGIQSLDACISFMGEVQKAHRTVFGDPYSSFDDSRF